MKILVLSTFPATNPRHGGQHRLYNVIRELEQSGHQVQSVGVLGSPSYEMTSGFVPYPDQKLLKKFIANPMLMDDWAIGEIFANDEYSYLSLVQKFDFVPNMIHVENPWLFKFAEKYRLSTSSNIKIIYGSENVEHRLKFDILKKYYSRTIAVDGKEKVLLTELNAIMKADAILAVSNTDKSWIQEHTDKPVVMAANGVSLRESTKSGFQKASCISGSEKYVIYCASDHAPNIHGFYEMFSSGVGFLAPNQKLIVAGAAGSAIKRDARFNQTPGLSKVFIDAGSVTEEVLQGLIDGSSVVILPVTEGSGTNLKTAEAIWSGKYIVATSKSMHGFDKYIPSDSIKVTDSTYDFKKAIRAFMEMPPNRLSNSEIEKRKAVLWSRTLFPMIGLIQNLNFEHDK